MRIAGAHDENNVSGLGVLFEVGGNVGKFGNVPSAGGGGGDIGAGKIAGVGFAAGKDFGNYDLVGQPESGWIIGESGFWTAESMWLYDSPNTSFRVLFFYSL